MTDAAGPAQAGGEIDIERFVTTPELLLQSFHFETDDATFVPMTEESYVQSVSLDSRIETAQGQAGRIPLETLDRVVIGRRPERRALHFIFHTGHCGATLLSRLLGKVDGLFSLREPPPLDMLSRQARLIGRPEATIGLDRWKWANTVNLHLMARTWHGSEVALVKTTSHCSQIVQGLAGWAPSCRSILLHVDIEPYIATLMADDGGEEVAREVDALYYRDFRSIAGEGAPPPAELTPARGAALVWLTHMFVFSRMHQDPAFQGRVMPVDFEAYLAAPAAALAQICAFLERPIHEAQAAALTTDTRVMGGRGIDANARRQKLEAARKAHANEIADALAWAEPWIGRLGIPH